MIEAREKPLDRFAGSDIIQVMYTYKLMKPIGEGGFGQVFLARQVQTGALVAIKTLHHVTPDTFERFCREGRILHRTTHHNIVRLIDQYVHLGRPYIVMEYCDKGSVRSWVSDRKPQISVVAVLASISNALAALHQAGGFHRDVKPDNILLQSDANQRITPKLGDFGIARSIHTISPYVTRSPWGTEGYMAPELAHGVDFDCRCDLYSLGVTGTELLTGSRDHLALFQTDVPGELRQLLLEMTNPSPSLRPTAWTASIRFREIYRAISEAEQRARESTSTNIGNLLVVGGVLWFLAAAFGDDR